MRRGQKIICSRRQSQYFVHHYNRLGLAWLDSFRFSLLLALFSLLLLFYCRPGCCCFSGCTTSSSSVWIAFIITTHTHSQRIISTKMLNKCIILLHFFQQPKKKKNPHSKYAYPHHHHRLYVSLKIIHELVLAFFPLFTYLKKKYTAMRSCRDCMLCFFWKNNERIPISHVNRFPFHNYIRSKQASNRNSDSNSTWVQSPLNI